MHLRAMQVNLAHSQFFEYIWDANKVFNHFDLTHCMAYADFIPFIAFLQKISPE